MTRVEIRHFHLFAGLGGGAKGFNRAQPRIGNLQARFRCLGGIDVDGAAMRDFERLAGVPGTVLDLFDGDGYCHFHGWPSRFPRAEHRDRGACKKLLVGALGNVEITLPAHVSAT